MQIGEFISRLREKKQLSKRAVAKKLDKAIATYAYIESGRSSPQLANLIEIGGVLGYDVEIHVREGDQMFRLVEQGDKVVVDERPATLRVKRLDRIVESLTPEQIDKLCRFAEFEFPATQKKRIAKKG